MQDNTVSEAYRRRQHLLIIGICIFAFLAQSVMTYQTVYLKEIGFTASQTGLLSSLLSVANIFAISFWGIVSDRAGSVKKVLIPLTLAGYLLFSMVPLLPAGGTPEGRAAGMTVFLVFTVFLALVHFFYNPAVMLNENLIVRDCTELDLNYGRCRSIGSFTYAVGGFIATAVATRFGTKAVFTAALIAVIPLIFFYLPVRDGADIRVKTQPDQASETGRTGKKRRSSGRSHIRKEDVSALLSNRAFQFFLVAVMLMYIASACRNGFYPYFMDAIGVDTGIYGMFIGYGAFMEIPSILMLRRFHSRLSYRTIMAMGSAVFGLSCLLMATVADNVLWIFVISTLNGLANGMNMTAGLNYVYEIAPPSLKATGQSIYQVVGSAAAIAGASLGGFAFDRLGIRPFYGVTTLIYAGAVALLILPALLSGHGKTAGGPGK